MECPEPKMSSKEVLKIQMSGLKNNNENDDGIEIVYQFASPRNKDYTGPYNKFKNMIKQNYQPLLNFDYWGISGPAIKSNKNRNYQQDIFVVKRGKKYEYRFQMSRQYDYRNMKPIWDNHSNMCLNKYWRTDSVKPIGNSVIEEFTNNQRNLGKNIYNQPLELCSLSPKTGFYRDGYCNTGPQDHGTHTVCTQVNDRFLKFTKSRGNDLSTPSPDNNFPGLKDGDYWCLCANRYKEAYDAGIRMNVNTKASHRKTLDYVDSSSLS